MAMDKTFDAAAAEPRISALWDEAHAFRAGANAKPGKPSFSVMIPPPNVTGALRIGVLRTPALRPGQAYLLESQIKAKRKSQSRRIRPQRLTFISTSTETAATDVATARIVVKP